MRLSSSNLRLHLAPDLGVKHNTRRSYQQCNAAHWHRITGAKQGNYDIRAVLNDLKSCSTRQDLQWGRRIHAKVVENGVPSNMYIATALTKMYAKCGSMADARWAFDSVHKPDIVAWTALLLGYAENGEGHLALDLFSKMKADGCAPNSVAYVAALKACASLAVNGDASRGLKMGCEIHADIGDHLDLHVQSTLVDMYSKCGRMLEAREVFASIQMPNVVPWNALLLGYVENGEARVCLELFSKMKDDGCTPNHVTYVAALKACASLAANGSANAKARGLALGCKIHLEIGDHLNPYVRCTLIDMYAKCGNMAKAYQVFKTMLRPDVACRTALLLGYAENGEGQVALNLFFQMKADGCTSSSVTYLAALKACTSLAVSGDSSGKAQGLAMGSKIHSEIGDHLDSYVQCTLVDMYAKCGSMVQARRVFNTIEKPDVTAWTALVLGYADNGEGQVALNLFSKMKGEGCAPNAVTYVAALKACTSLAASGEKPLGLEIGSEIHLDIGDHFDPYVKSTLIDMYAKCGSMFDAHQVFDAILEPDVVSWNALLLGYVENGEGHVCLDLLSKMKAAGCAPTSLTYFAALRACGATGALTLGRKLHSEITEFTAQLVTCLVDFYAKCGSMLEARAVFDQHPKARDITAWTALLAGYSSCGDAGSVFNLFEAMQDAGVRPDGVTFLAIFLCCSHAGLVRKARQYLEAMPAQYGVTPDIFHHNCVVDLLGRGNELVEAMAILRRMPCTPNAVTWSAMLAACHKWKNVEIGRLAFHSFLDMDQTDASAYILMAHLYGSQGMREEQERVLQKFGTQRPSGQACVADGMGQMVKFVVGQMDTPEVTEKLAQILESVRAQALGDCIREEQQTK